MGVDTNSKLMFGYKFDNDSEIDFYKEVNVEPKKCFEHDIPYDPDNLHKFFTEVRK